MGHDQGPGGLRGEVDGGVGPVVVFEQHVGGGEGGVAAKIDFLGGGEPTQVGGVVRGGVWCGVGCDDDEGGFGEVVFRGDGLHGLDGQCVGEHADAGGVAGEQVVREGVDDMVGGHGGISVGGDRLDSTAGY